MSTTRSLPDPDISLHDSCDFIMGSRLARRALRSDWPCLALVTRDLIEAIHRLVQSCHMPEFTDHGLPHLCSLVDRISRWTCADGEFLTEKIEPVEAGKLLLATLLHDIGMLSQKPEDMPDDALPEESNSQIRDPAEWVRRTHVKRLRKLAHRILHEATHEAFGRDSRFKQAIEIGEAHNKWPWEWRNSWPANPKNGGLAAVVAVAWVPWPRSRGHVSVAAPYGSSDGAFQL